MTPLAALRDKLKRLRLAFQSLKIKPLFSIAFVGVLVAHSHAQVRLQGIFDSTLQITAQVTGPANSLTLRSTTTVTAGDTVRWTSALQSSFPYPKAVSGSLLFPPGSGWSKGSFKAPPQTTPQWRINGVWQRTEPAQGAVVQELQWLSNAAYRTEPGLAVSKTVDLSAVGDGYRVIPYKDRLFVVNHHGALNGTNPLKCRLAKDGSNCPDWPAAGVDFRLNAGGLLTTELQADSTGETGQNPLEGLNHDTGHLFVVVNRNAVHYIACADLNARRSCGSWPVGTGGGDMVSLNQVGDHYYVINNQSELVCFDVRTEQFCEHTETPSQRVIYGITSISDWTNSVVLQHRLFFMAQVTTLGGPRAFCHDTSTGAPCSNWPAGGIRISGEAGANPWLWADGSGRGVCSRTGDCVDIQGQHFKASAEYVKFFEARRSGWGYRYRNISAIMGSKVYAASAGDAAAPAEIGCFDTAANARCGSWDSVDSDPYTSRLHPFSDHCVMVMGHKSVGRIIDVRTGGQCYIAAPAQVLNLKFDPKRDDFQCNPGRSFVQRWGDLRLSRSLKWGTPGGLKSVQVEILDAQGNALPSRYGPIRAFANGQYSLAIGSGPQAIPFSEYPVLQFKLTLAYVEGGEATTFGVDLSYQGDPVQVCASTVVPSAPDCLSTASVSTKTTEIGGDAFELNSDKVGMTTGLNTQGYAALTVASTDRLNLKAFSPKDPRTQVLQGRWAMDSFSGDLWAFGFTGDGRLDGTQHASAAGSLAASGRKLFTGLAPSAANGATQVIPLEWDRLSAAQKSALQVNSDGVQDGQGPGRLAYLQGTDGPFRARPAGKLGPVINSAPAVLPVVPGMGLSEKAFPGYADYRSQQHRPVPLALYGGNDGAVHAFHVADKGLVEAWAFTPQVMMPKVNRYTDLDIAAVATNPYFVDNIPILGHVDTVHAGWRAVAVITYGRGARAITALDVTHADLSAGQGVLFEYQHSDHPDLADLGYVIGQPSAIAGPVSSQLVKLGGPSSGGSRPAVLVGNGLASHERTAVTGGSSGTGRPVLYAFYLDGNTGSRWTRWDIAKLWPRGAADAGLSVGNGLGVPTPVDVDGDGVVDLVYVGDLQGNLWRLDVHDLGNVSVSRLFKAALDQPIIQAPFVSLNPQAKDCKSAGTARCWQVVFHTGEPLSPLEVVTSSKTQAIYSVLDHGLGTEVALASLQPLRFDGASTLAGIDYRSISGAAVDYAANGQGWRLNLGAAEHGVGAPKLLPNGLLMFSSVLPTTPVENTKVCVGPRSWLNEVDPLYGVSELSTFDTNGDGVIDSRDHIAASSPAPRAPQSMAISGAQYGPPFVLQPSASDGQDMQLLLPSLGQDTGQKDSWGGAGSGKGSLDVTGKNSITLRHANRAKLGRMSWREIR